MFFNVRIPTTKHGFPPNVVREMKNGMIEWLSEQLDKEENYALESSQTRQGPQTVQDHQRRHR